MSKDFLNKPNSVIYCNLSTVPLEQIVADTEVLAVVTFDEEISNTQTQKVYQTGLQCLNDRQMKEVWTVSGPVEAGKTDGFCWSKTEDYMFVGFSVSEQRGSNLGQLVEDAYKRVLRFVNAQGYSQLVRIWNYIADLNAGEGDSERYKQFCYGRHLAFVGAGYDINDFPAATAVGRRSGDMLIYLLAGKQKCVHFENPRQTSAYCYPREYGLKSPSFARATYLENRSQGIVYLSGTASIIGYETQCKGDAQGQLAVTLDNIERLLDSVANRLQISDTLLPDLLKVYVRDRSDFQVIYDRIRSHYGDRPEILFLQADICRADLVVEAEGVVRFQDGQEPCQKLPF